MRPGVKFGAMARTVCEISRCFPRVIVCRAPPYAVVGLARGREICESAVGADFPCVVFIMPAKCECIPYLFTAVGVRETQRRACVSVNRPETATPTRPATKLFLTLSALPNDIALALQKEQPAM